MSAAEPLRNYVWCTYRVWSFRILEALVGIPGWRCGLVVTTKDCIYDFSALEGAGIPILRIDPKADLAEGGRAYRAIVDLNPGAIFHYGWSWLVPDALLELCPNVTLHPGKLPKDRGGSPIQNQIRNGESWTWANVLQMSSGLDEGPVYLRERISLAGDSADDVWARMTATGAALTRDFLAGIADGNLSAEPQADEEPSFYRRVKPEQAEIVPGELSAVEIYNRVRAHAESDPNSYVVPAFMRVGDARLVIERARLIETAPEGPSQVIKGARDLEAADLLRLCAEVNDGRMSLLVEDPAGGRVQLTRVYVSR